MSRTPSTRYAITATTPSGVVQETRTMASSAVVLALFWMERGYTQVEVADPVGKLLSVDSYRASFLKGPTRFV